jgi:hypothetical protein
MNFDVCILPEQHQLQQLLCSAEHAFHEFHSQVQLWRANKIKHFTVDYYVKYSSSVHGSLSRDELKSN